LPPVSPNQAEPRQRKWNFLTGQPKLGATVKQPSIAPRTFDWPPIGTQILPRPPIDDMSKSVEFPVFWMSSQQFARLLD